MAVELLSVSAYARHRGCNEKAVRKAIAENRITFIERDSKKLIDPAVADIQWATNTRARADSRPGSVKTVEVRAPAAGPGPASGAAWSPDGADFDIDDYKISRARRERAEAGRAELALARESKELIEREPSVAAVFTAFRQLRDGCMVLGRKVAPKVAKLTDSREIQLVIDEEMRELLQSFSTRTLASLTERMSEGAAVEPPGEGA